MANKNYKEIIRNETTLTEIRHTNRLFLNLLYNLSKYPDTQRAKHLVRKGLFEFEEKVVFKRKSGKK